MFRIKIESGRPWKQAKHKKKLVWLAKAHLCRQS